MFHLDQKYHFQCKLQRLEKTFVFCQSSCIGYEQNDPGERHGASESVDPLFGDPDGGCGCEGGNEGN